MQNGVKSSRKVNVSNGDTFFVLYSQCPIIYTFQQICRSISTLYKSTLYIKQQFAIDQMHINTFCDNTLHYMPVCLSLHVKKQEEEERSLNYHLTPIFQDNAGKPSRYQNVSILNFIGVSE